MEKFDHPNLDVKYDSESDVKTLLKTAKQRKEDRIKYHLLSEALDGKTINVTKNTDLFEVLNKERMEFEEILRLHPEEVNETIEYVKQRKEEQNGKWYNPDSQAWWGEKGAIPPCVYYARPASYWKDKRLMNNFLNQFSKFKIAEGKL